MSDTIEIEVFRAKELVNEILALKLAAEGLYNFRKSGSLDKKKRGIKFCARALQTFTAIPHPQTADSMIDPGKWGGWWEKIDDAKSEEELNRLYNEMLEEFLAVLIDNEHIVLEDALEI